LKPRKKILTILRSKSHKVELPDPWISGGEFDSITDEFANALKNVEGEGYMADSIEEAWEILSKLFGELEARKVVVTDEPPLNQVNLSEMFPNQEWCIVGKTNGDLRDFCSSADIGLTSADAALAETGSVVVSSGPGRSRAASLLPPIHIVLIPTSKLLPDIFAWTAKRTGTLASQVVLISGPSKTADIEQTLVVGVHGPKRFIVIIYSDGDLQMIEE
jgi:L-lactate dehydrogenase complex protein LldG